MNRCTSILVALLLVNALPAAATAEDWIGYRGQGNGVHRGNPPTSFDDKTGQNILWKAPMPEWGHACPTAVKGRVLVLCEPGIKSDWPTLLCLDEKDGRTLWQREINHLPVLIQDAAEREVVAATWHRVLAKYRTAYGLFNQWYYAADDEAQEAVEQKFQAEGLNFGGWSGGGYGQLRRMKFTDSAAMSADQKTLARGGLNLETWYHGCGLGTHCVGQAFLAPLSDGERIYIATGLHSYACFDFDGNLLWLRSYRGDGCSGGNDYCKNARQPLLYQNLLLSDVGAVLRAIDRKTGVLVWSARVRENPKGRPGVKTKPGHLSIFSPVVIKVGDGTRSVPDTSTGADGTRRVV